MKLGAEPIGRMALAAAAAAWTMASLALPAGAASSHHGTHVSRPHSIPVRCKHRNKASGAIRYSDWQFPDTLNPYQTSSAASFETISTMHDDLTTYDNLSRPVPVLITRIPSTKNGLIRDGGKTILANMKQGLQWSNGTEITAADVRFGWEIGMDPDSGLCEGSCDVIKGIDVKGKYGLVFHLRKAYAPFIPSGLPPVWPTAWKGSWKKNDVKGAVKKLFQTSTYNFEDPSYPTNGPFQIESFFKDDRIILHPMKYYSTMTCGARVAKLIFAFYSSKPGMIAAAASQETDTTTNYTVADIPALRQHTTSYSVSSKPAYDIETLVLNVDAKYHGHANPLHNTKVRLALALALDKHTVIQNALGLSPKETANLIAWTPLINTSQLVQPFADRSLKGQWDPLAHRYLPSTGHGQALADARKLLDQTPYKGGFSVDAYTVTGNPVRQSEMAIVQASWHQIGVDVNLNYVESTSLFTDWQHHGILQRGNFQVALFDEIPNTPDPDVFRNDFDSRFIDREKKGGNHSENNSNLAGIHNRTFDKAFVAAASTFDNRVRQYWYNLWQVGLNQNAYWIPLFYRTEITTSNGRIGNFKPNPTDATDEWNTYDWYVRGRS